MSIIIKEVTTPKELKQFVKFNIELYKNHPYHVPGIIEEEITTLSKDKNPAFDFCESKYFLAYKDGKIVGRIAAIINHKTNEIWKQSQGRFGFIDFIDDLEVSGALLKAAEEWVRSKGLDAIHGPMGFTDLDHEGMLVEGFDQLGTMATIYNHPYYPQHLEKHGYIKDQDWHEFKIYIPEAIPDKHKRISEIVMKKYGLIIKKFKKTKDVWPYAQKIFDLLNTAYSQLYGYSPLSQKQIEYYIKMYIPMLRYDIVTLIVREEDDEVIGVGVTIPNLSKALQKAKGKLFPFGFIHLLKALYGKNKVVDLLLIGVHPEYQNKGVNALLFYDLIPAFRKNGYEYAESNPELESNDKVQAQWDYFRKEQHKARRAFIKNLK